MIIDDLLAVLDVTTKAEKAELINDIIAKGGGKTIKMIFDDMVKFNVAVVRLPELRLYNPELTIPLDEELENLLEKLADRRLTGNHALMACSNLGNRMTDDQFSMFCDILESNPRLGIGVTDLNKRCELFKVPQFKVHLCKSLKDVKDKLAYQKTWVIQPKIDGNRIVSIKELITKQYSRKGHVRDSMDHIVTILNKYQGPCVFDGEVEYRDSLEATGAIRRKGKQAKEAIYTLFGIYHLGQWNNEQHTDEYIKVYTEARNFVDSLSEEDKRFVRVVPSYLLGEFTSVQDLLDAAEVYYEQFLVDGYEGSVMKTLDHVYLPSSGSKRSMDTIKNKPWKDSEATVIGFNESKAIPDSLGSFQGIDKEGREFDIAPGNITHDELDYIWNHQDKFVDKIVEFKFQGYSIYNIPRHPTATKFRDDV